MDILILHKIIDRESSDSLFNDLKNSGGYNVGIQSYQSFDEVDLGIGLINILFINTIPITSDMTDHINEQINSEVVKELFNSEELVFVYVKENDTFYELEESIINDDNIEIFDVYDYNEFIIRINSVFNLQNQSVPQHSKKIVSPDEELEGLSPNEATFIKKIAQNKLKPSRRNKSSSTFGNKFKML